jgi:uncharacterized membrane protein
MVIYIKMASAILFYAVYLVGLVLFAISPALRLESWLIAIGVGLLLCVIAYGSDGVAGMEILKEWSIALTLVDITWGVCVSAVSAMAGFYAFRILAGN